MNYTALKLDSKVEEIRRILPNIRPLNEFLHLNMLPGMGDSPFFDSLFEFSRTYSTYPFQPIKFYQDKYHSGEIDHDILDNLIKEKSNQNNEQMVRNELFREINEFEFPEKTYRPIRKLISKKLNVSLNELSEPLIIRILSSYFDQGFATESIYMSNGELDLVYTLIENLAQSYIPFYPLEKKFLKNFIGKPHKEIVLEILDLLVESDQLKDIYIEESLLSLKGWAGFINTVELNPNILVKKRNTSLMGYLALRLIVEYSWIHKLMSKFNHVKLEDFNDAELVKKEYFSENSKIAYEIWQIAYEKTYHNEILKQMSSHGGRTHQEYDAQLLFCIDDRECSLRGILEVLSSKIETFGTPGHFGFDFYYKKSQTSLPVKQCPAPLKATHLIINRRGHNTSASFQKKILFPWLNKFENSFRQNITTIFSGFYFSIKFFIDIFFPRLRLANTSVTPNRYEIFNFKALHSIKDQKVGENDLIEGYSFEEGAQRVASTLASIGLVKNFAKCVYIVSHGSTTTNNPYFLAYGCGACCGRNGSINAVLFCQIANDHTVRNILSEKYNIHLGEKTIFYPCFHDTCTDQIIYYFDHNQAKDSHKSILKEVNDVIVKALKKNAKLRCNDFYSAEKDISEENAIKHVHDRATSMFEPRPELGHTGNALCIIGNRKNTRGLNLQRRAFLQSYDYETDPSGEILKSILSAAVPVCGGINLDYFYSRSSNASFGSGSKLSHNIVGLFGVTNGVEDDLLTGLAYQMVEKHEPIRIMLTVEQNLPVVEKLLDNSPEIKKWIDNEWVKFAVLTPEKEVYIFEDHKFVLFEEEFE